MLRHDYQFGRAFHLRMAGEDLLDQGRAGTVQSDNEDRTVVGAAAALQPFEEVRCDGRERFIDVLGDGDLVRIESRGPQRIADGIMAKALFVFPAVLECLAEREMDVQRVVLAGPAAERGLHPPEIARLRT